MKKEIDKFNRFHECHPFVYEQWGWRYWRCLEDTPYTLGEINLAGWNSYEEMVKGKKAFRSIGQEHDDDSDDDEEDESDDDDGK